VTEILSRTGVPMLANIIVHYDAFDAEYAEMCNDETLLTYQQHTANRGRILFNKYYQKINESEMYRLAIFMHPSMCIMYLKASGWDPKWITTAIEIAECCWRTHYQPVAALEAVTPATSHGFPPTSYYGSNCNVIAKPLVKLHENGKPIMHNPLAWWYRQRLSGHKRDGLTQMAIDVLSMPASSVDVEQAFLFAGSSVTKRRHTLAP
ncbi:hypothetical protein BDV93DRAFT_426578, partial [Ceratobasidium sp. AG-I]